MNTSQLYGVNLETDDAVHAFANTLQPLLPYSLPILGCLYSGDLDPSNNTYSLRVWTSFPFERNVQSPGLFSVIAYSELNDRQLRYFCSAETFQSPPTADEEKHVRDILDTFIYVLKTEDAVVQGIDCKAALRHEKGEGIFVGSLHNRWASCLQGRIPWGAPCIKFVCRPDSRQDTAWNDIEGKWEITEMQESDLEFINSRAVFPRSRQFLKARIPFSVCVRRKGEEGPPIAWEMMYSDGSSGMLHVEPEYRKAGLGRKCVAALGAKMEQKYRCKDEALIGGYPYTRWEMTDVMIGNPAGIALAASRKGWKQLWISHWVHLTASQP